MVVESSSKLLSCVCWNDVLCSFRTSAAFGLMDRCFDCVEFRRFEREMEADEDEFWLEVDSERWSSGVVCACDKLLCDRLPLCDCFSVEAGADGSPSDILRSVCPRFDVSRVGGVTKRVFEGLRRREGGSK